MGRIKRQYYQHAVYHVYNRGNNGVRVLLDNQDKRNFLEVIARYRERFQFKVYGIVLMDNHYHMVLETNLLHDISKVLQAVQLAYGSQYRKRYKFIGQLWQSRFQSKIIFGDKYILECLEYLHNNPVKAGLVNVATEYVWSSSRFYSDGGKSKIEGILEVDQYGDTTVISI